MQSSKSSWKETNSTPLQVAMAKKRTTSSLPKPVEVQFGLTILGHAVIRHKHDVVGKYIASFLVQSNRLWRNIHQIRPTLKKSLGHGGQLVLKRNPQIAKLQCPHLIEGILVNGCGWTKSTFGKDKVSTKWLLSDLRNSMLPRNTNFFGKRGSDNASKMQPSKSGTTPRVKPVKPKMNISLPSKRGIKSLAISVSEGRNWSAVCIPNASRYLRKYWKAMALQRSTTSGQMETHTQKPLSRSQTSQYITLRNHSQFSTSIAMQENMIQLKSSQSFTNNATDMSMHLCQRRGEQKQHQSRWAHTAGRKLMASYKICKFNWASNFWKVYLCLQATFYQTNEWYGNKSKSCLWNRTSFWVEHDTETSFWVEHAPSSCLRGQATCLLHKAKSLDKTQAPKDAWRGTTKLPIADIRHLSSSDLSWSSHVCKGLLANGFHSCWTHHSSGFCSSHRLTFKKTDVTS